MIRLDDLVEKGCYQKKKSDPDRLQPNHYLSKQPVERTEYRLAAKRFFRSDPTGHQKLLRGTLGSKDWALYAVLKTENGGKRLASFPKRLRDK